MADVAAKVRLIAETDRGLLHAGAAITATAFLTKAAIWPINSWLVPAYMAASAPVAALFALMTKVGLYTLLRLWTLLFAADAGPSAHFGTQLFLYGGLATLAFGALGLMASVRLGRIAGFSIIVSSGTILSAVGVGTADVTSAALFYLLSATLAELELVPSLLDHLLGDTRVDQSLIRCVERVDDLHRRAWWSNHAEHQGDDLMSSLIEIERERGPTVRRARGEANHQHRKLAPADDAFGGRSEKSIAQRATAAPTHDDQLGLHRARGPGDLLGCSAAFHERLDANGPVQRLAQVTHLAGERLPCVTFGAALLHRPQTPRNDVQQGHASIVRKRQPGKPTQDAIRTGREIDRNEHGMKPRGRAFTRLLRGTWLGSAVVHVHGPRSCGEAVMHLSVQLCSGSRWGRPSRGHTAGVTHCACASPHCFTNPKPRPNR